MARRIVEEWKENHNYDRVRFGFRRHTGISTSVNLINPALILSCLNAHTSTTLTSELKLWWNQFAVCGFHYRWVWRFQLEKSRPSPPPGRGSAVLRLHGIHLEIRQDTRQRPCCGSRWKRCPFFDDLLVLGEFGAFGELETGSAARLGASTPHLCGNNM
jgi:hypothetical protein